MRQVVADTGALISLEKITNGFSFIRLIYNQILIPPQVLTEVSHYHYYLNGKSYLDAHGIADLVVVEPVEDIGTFTVTLGDGERFAISLAHTKQLPLLIEEQKGARQAKLHNLVTLGTGAVVIHAYREQIIDKKKAENILQELRSYNRISEPMMESLRAYL